MSELQVTRGFEIRQIQTNQVLGAFGYGLEIIDGGLRLGENKIIVGRGTFGTDQAYTDEAAISCWPGNKLISNFDYLRMPAVQPGGGAGDGIDTVRVKVHTARNAVFTDAPPTGLVRRRALTRGLTASINNVGGAAVLLYESHPYLSGTIAIDDWSTESRLTDKGYIEGFVAGIQPFNVWVLTASFQTYVARGTFFPTVKATAFDHKTAAPTFNVAATPAYTYDFTWGQGSTTSTVASRVMCPATPFEIWLEPTSATATIFSYALAVRSMP